jgi:hypothetical protein
MLKGNFRVGAAHWASAPTIIETATGAMALTFDDALLQPGHHPVRSCQSRPLAAIST